jgi:osmotically inducible protein OsmC
MERSSTVVWHGSGKEGNGAITSGSKALNNASYSWNTRFAEVKGTNPEELIAAAHAACFTMKLSFLLSGERHIPEEIITTSTITLKENLTQSHLVVKAKVPNITQEFFLECAEKAKNECPVSKALNLKITMDATIELPAKVES